QLGSPKGNLDTGSIIGSYIGLFFLAAAFVAIGIFSSSLTDNIIISFIVAALLCFMVHWGFSYVANIAFLGDNTKTFINALGMNYHYASISKGALFLKDIVYFISIVILFVLATKSSINITKN
ncbi:MAG TPA: gliding motility-associated ABC transporter permease subunit GldF, partial [Saprospiraceae bacterium]|nr:gliding motility-associated ABC transporter permease subunit GldF [Saprospiraceae bacterium]